MHISNIKVQNFRLFKILDLSLNAGLNVLVGENDSGKILLGDVKSKRGNAVNGGPN